MRRRPHNSLPPGGLTRGMTGNAPVVLIVFYAGVKGMPLSAH
ncbi:hypothetical protein EC912_103263 [Luteibacter rhizovicinus]|uniref:Uncharacterized protein n=1 Tax=Luteibacter rhizovicinus TaxID=242606 RepID=A0A4R3YST5_9GAMM|nr:hypothetical protein EC912_103263 [Luteibacter rhizovicinus]